MTPHSSSSPNSLDVELDEIRWNSLGPRRVANRIGKFARQATRWIAAGALAFGSFAGLSDFSHGIEHHVISSSAPHRTVGCETGNCQPFSKSFGHYRPSWRRWPTATEYPGVKKPSPSLDVPQDKIPEAREELRFERRTRSDRPLDPEPSDLPPDVVPGVGSELDPNNPFQTVPDSDLPDQGAGDGVGANTDTALPDPGFGSGGDAAPDPAESLPLETQDNSSTNDILGLPDPDPAPGNAPGGFGLPDTGTDTSPLPETDNGLDDLPSDNNDSFDPFAPMGNRLRNQPARPRVANEGDELELIRQELLRRNMITAQTQEQATANRAVKDQILDQLAVDPIPQVKGTTTDLPKFEVLGNFTGEFAATDLVATSTEDRGRVAHASLEQEPKSAPSQQYIQDHELLRRQIQELRDQIQQSGISNQGQPRQGQPRQGEPVRSRQVRVPSKGSQASAVPKALKSQKAQPSSGIVYEDTGNPLRPRRRMMGSPTLQSLPPRATSKQPKDQRTLASKNQTVQRQAMPSTTKPKTVSTPRVSELAPIRPGNAQLNGVRTLSGTQKPGNNAFIRTSSKAGSIPNILQTKRREEQRQRNAAAARASTIKATDVVATTPSKSKAGAPALPSRMTKTVAGPQSTVKIRTAPAKAAASEAKGPAQSKSVTKQPSTSERKIDPKRNIAATNRRSLRETLRKNPLRR